MMASWAGGWGGGPWVGIVWLLLWAALVIGALYLFRRRPLNRDPGESATTALAERYARGEIDENEYRKRLRVLRER
jgi:putative membrane protein